MKGVFSPASKVYHRWCDFWFQSSFVLSWFAQCKRFLYTNNTALHLKADHYTNTQFCSCDLDLDPDDLYIRTWSKYWQDVPAKMNILGQGIQNLEPKRDTQTLFYSCNLDLTRYYPDLRTWPHYSDDVHLKTRLTINRKQTTHEHNTLLCLAPGSATPGTSPTPHPTPPPPRELQNFLHVTTPGPRYKKFWSWLLKLSYFYFRRGYM